MFQAAITSNPTEQIVVMWVVCGTLGFILVAVGWIKSGRK